MTLDFTTIIFAIIALVVFLKLFSKFGESSEEDEARSKIIDLFASQENGKGGEVKKNKIIDITPRILRKRDTKGKKSETFSKNLEVLNPKLQSKIKKSEKKSQEVFEKFLLTDFLELAEDKLEEVADAFTQKDTETLGKILSKNLYSEFKKQLDNANKKNERIHSSIISVLSKEIVDIKLQAQFLYIDVKFKTEQINFVEDKDGKIITGNKKHIDIMEEVWSFKRDTDFKEVSNWKIVGISNVE